MLRETLAQGEEICVDVELCMQEQRWKSFAIEHNDVDRAALSSRWAV